MSVCEVKGLCKEYSGFALKDISFCLEAGTVTGFIGRNGAGKTTTVKSMLNIVHPSAGEVRYFDLPLSGNENQIKQKIGFSTGTVNYYPKKKIGDIAKTTSRFYKSWDEQAYKKYLDMFSLDENKTPLQLSEGMRVKFNLLLALSHGARVLILDEPTSGLDPFSRDELCGLFSELKEHGPAILFSTHITSDLEKCADNILYIRSGRQVAFSSRKEFADTFGADNETLEQTVLRLEREAKAK